VSFNFFYLCNNNVTIKTNNIRNYHKILFKKMIKCYLKQRRKICYTLNAILNKFSKFIFLSCQKLSYENFIVKNNLNSTVFS